MRESVRPIEPGCLAITLKDGVGSEMTAGRVVHVIGKSPIALRRGAHCGECGGEFWRLEESRRFSWCGSCALLRIDPDEDIEREEREEVERV